MTGLSIGRIQASIVQPDREDHHERPADDARDHEHRNFMPVDGLDEVGARHGGDRCADAENARHHSSLSNCRFGEFVCPCHGRIYSARTGDVLGGPPPSALPAIPVTVANGRLYVD
jgi:nitrite reductase/ring-hydroxylating ferredoxin subunit